MQARRLWRAIEPIHAVVYFDPGPPARAKAIGLRGWWMGYFAGRFAPMGAVDAATVAPIAYGFAPGMVARSLPDAWSFARPDTVIADRLDAAADALDARMDASEELDALLWDAVGGADLAGRPLGAAWSTVARPARRSASVWLATTILREHRGDGHVQAAVAAGLSGLAAGITHVASGATTRHALQPNRGWTDEEWDAAADELRQRGLLDAGGRLTPDGEELRADIERETDRLAAGPADRLGDGGLARLEDEAARVGDVIPDPNPIGFRPAER